MDYNEINLKGAVHKFLGQTVGQTAGGNTIWRILDRTPYNSPRKSAFCSSSRLQSKWQSIWNFSLCDEPGSAFFVPKRMHYAPHHPSELIMRNRSMFQRQRDISPPSTRIKIKSRQFKTWGRNRFKTDISPLSARIKIKSRPFKIRRRLSPVLPFV